MLGMLRLWRSEVLKRLGWKLLLQIHDEVILEGPKESRDEVCMYAWMYGWIPPARIDRWMDGSIAGDGGGAGLHGESVCWKLYE